MEGDWNGDGGGDSVPVEVVDRDGDEGVNSCRRWHQGGHGGGQGGRFRSRTCGGSSNVQGSWIWSSEGSSGDDDGSSSVELWCILCLVNGNASGHVAFDALIVSA